MSVKPAIDEIAFVKKRVQKLKRDDAYVSLLTTIEQGHLLLIAASLMLLVLNIVSARFFRTWTVEDQQREDALERTKEKAPGKLKTAGVADPDETLSKKEMAASNAKRKEIKISVEQRDRPRSDRVEEGCQVL